VQLLSSRSWIECLGWILVQFFWQGVVIAVLYAAMRRRTRKASSPHAQYLLACGALLTMMAAPLLTWTVDVVYGATPGLQYGQFLLWVAMVWFAGELVLWSLLIRDWIVAIRMRLVQIQYAPPEWQEILDDLCAWIGLHRPVRLLVSTLVQHPVAAGCVRPVLLVPSGFLGALPEQQLEALLLYTLAHIRRYEYVASILQRIAEALLFYHPAVWWISKHIHTERELCCEQIAMLASGTTLTHSQPLAESCSSDRPHSHAFRDQQSNLATLGW
jgi:hypothetical protein